MVLYIYIYQIDEGNTVASSNFMMVIFESSAILCQLKMDLLFKRITIKIDWVPSLNLWYLIMGQSTKSRKVDNLFPLNISLYILATFNAPIFSIIVSLRLLLFWGGQLLIQSSLEHFETSCTNYQHHFYPFGQSYNLLLSIWFTSGIFFLIRALQIR